MSREILAFGAFSGFAAVYAASLWLEAIPGLAAVVPRAAVLLLQGSLSVIVAVAGLAAVFCSAMLYHVTRRRYWKLPHTGLRFFGSALLLGLSTTLTTSVIAASAFSGAHPGLSAAKTLLGLGVIVVTLLKLAGEMAVLRHGQSEENPDLQRTAKLLSGALSDITRQRVAAAALGGVLLPSLLLLSGSQGTSSSTTSFVALLSLVALTGGELLERRLFFSAASPPRMPGVVGG
jgi:DMSO reductase anchor subunit